MQVISEGSVRVDLVGGTLDLEPINLIIPNVVTMNVATSLKAKVIIEKTSDDKVVIESLDYKSSFEFEPSDFSLDKLADGSTFGPMLFVCHILSHFKLTSNVKLTLQSGAPAGSGLGGSSSMGATLYKGLCKYQGISFNVNTAVRVVKSIEGRILNQGVPGYQDYFPALTGGILALRPSVSEVADVVQLYDEDLKDFLEKHLTLVYSGISRDSGINNWDVYKKFFDKDPLIIESMNNIAKISEKFFNSVINKEYSQAIKLIGLEGNLRTGLSSTIMPDQIQNLHKELIETKVALGLKMCGAGGGGCFIIVHNPDQRGEVESMINKYNMNVLDFKIDRPLT